MDKEKYAVVPEGIPEGDRPSRIDEKSAKVFEADKEKRAVRSDVIGRV
jgi:hypothetical protein